jgi:hypothetical protein
MKKILTLLLVSLSMSVYAQWVELSAVGGAAPYKISAGIKNATCGVFNFSAAFVKVKMVDVGVQFTYTTKVTICNIMSPGLFADLVMRNGESDKNLFIAGVQGNYVNFGKITTPGAFFKDGSIDSVSTKIDNAISFGVRLGYKRQITDHIYGSLLISPTYSFPSVIPYADVSTNDCAVFFVPVMVGISARF